MGKFAKIIGLMMVGIIGLYGCSFGQSKEAEELDGYTEKINDLLTQSEEEIGNIEEQALEMDEEDYVIYMNETFIPTYEQFLADLQKLKSEDEQIMEVHALMVEGTELSIKAAKEEVAYYESDTAESVEEQESFSSLYIEGQQLISEYYDKVIALGDEYGLDLYTEE